MNAVRLDVPLQPSLPDVEKKITFYRVVAAIIFVLALVWLLSDFNIPRTVFFVLFAFVSYKLYQSAEGNDFLKILERSYLLLDDDKFVLQQSHYAFQPSSDLNATTILWSAVKELRIGDFSFEVLFQSGATRTVVLDYLSPADLELVRQRLWEVKAKYTI